MTVCFAPTADVSKTSALIASRALMHERQAGGSSDLPRGLLNVSFTSKEA